MTDYQRVMAWLDQFLIQWGVDLSKRSALTILQQYQFLVAQLNAYHSTGVLSEAYDAGGAFSDIATKLTVLGYPELSAMMNDAEGSGYWDEWPIDPTYPPV